MTDPYITGAKFGVDTATSVLTWFRKAKGNKRELIGELKNNQSYLEMVSKDGIPLADVVNKLSISSYESLANSGFNFNKMQSEKIAEYPGLKGTNMSSWVGRTPLN